MVAATAVAFAQSTVTPLPEQAPAQVAPLGDPVADLAKTHWGDAKAGQAKAGACAACHGVDGNPGDPQYPRIAGMPERYVAHQLALFKAGERTTGMAAVMMPMAQPLSAQDMRDIGAYFAQQKAGAGIADDTLVATGPYAGSKFYEAGQTLFRTGDAARGIPACMLPCSDVRSVMSYVTLPYRLLRLDGVSSRLYGAKLKPSAVKLKSWYVPPGPVGLPPL